MNQVVDFKDAIRKFPRHVLSHVLGFVYAWLTQFEDLVLLSGSLLVTSKSRKLKGFAVYLLLWLYYRRPR